MIHKTVKHIHRLRVYFLALIIVAFFYQIGIEPASVGKFIGAKIGRTIGMSVSIPENPFNRLAMQLKEKEETLAQREKELSQKEKELNNKGWINSNIALFMAGGIVILFLLVLVNFYLDYKRRESNKRRN